MAPALTIASSANVNQQRSINGLVIYVSSISVPATFLSGATIDCNDSSKSGGFEALETTKYIS
jgi:hypothetical protein